MAKGRKATPTNIKVLKGNPGKRPINKDEPTFQPAWNPEPPPDMVELMDERAHNEWARVAPMLVESGVLTHGDLTAFATYCIAYSHLTEAQYLIRQNGLFYETTTKEGSIMQRKSPMVEIANQAMERMHKFMSEFGMTPASRTKLKVQKPEKQDPLEGMLG